MKPMQLAGLFGTLLVGISPSLADEPAATITQASDKITHSMSATAPGESAGAGTALHSGEFVKTGKTSLAEMVLDNKTVTRVGPNSVWSYSAAAHEANLQSGTMLFSNPKGGTMTFKSAAVTASVTNATCFVQKDGNNVVLGVIQGTAHVTIGSTSADLPAGKIVVATGTDNRVASFDVPDFVGTSPFFSHFQRALPTAKAIDHELADYQDKVARGFITPASGTAAASGDQHETASTNRHGHEMLNSTMNTSALTGSTRVSSSGFNLNGAGLGASSASSLTINGSTTSSMGADSGSGISKAGSGAATLAGANSYTGGTSVSGGTILVSGGTITAGSGSGLTLGTFNGGGTTVVNGTTTISGSLHLGGGTISGSNGGTNGGTLTINNGGAGGGTITLSGGSGGTLTINH